ncbi:hypothetical protein C2G38_2027392 [Gigaspora rosea]|uniref:Uncharacterized protein n=1 Tax=Gigaspora rosea TaxID=44941 RepID=A0A397W6Y2_9GLOM|nr:hypothetical protein C2G38_2027392 [Gigaspora rosea]
MEMEKYIICFDKSNEKETQKSQASQEIQEFQELQESQEFQEFNILTSSLVIKQTNSAKKPKFELLIKSNLRFNPVWRDRYLLIKDQKKIMLLIKNPVAGREILESLAYVIEKDTIKEINNSNKKNPCNGFKTYCQ